MEGFFGDWFIEEGREYYENGNLRFEGSIIRGPDTTMAPDTLSKESSIGNPVSCGSRKLRVHHSFTIGFPMQKFPDSFAKGIEYDKEGNVVRVY